MNMQELNKEIEENGIYCLNVFGNEVKSIPVKRAIGLIKQLDEPKPVKVKQFVADWYEENKDDFEGNLYRCTHNIPSVFDGAKLNEFERWFLSASTKSFQILVNMHQFGYEVEKEPKYTVKFKATNQYLCDDDGIGLHISPSFRSNFRKSDLEKLSLTEVFDSPLFEVVEVE
jgi:hypothetical protein